MDFQVRRAIACSIERRGSMASLADTTRALEYFGNNIWISTKCGYDHIGARRVSRRLPQPSRALAGVLAGLRYGRFKRDELDIAGILEYQRNAEVLTDIMRALTMRNMELCVS
jgi:hypothetical protein